MAIDLDMAKLGVGDKHPAVKDCRADTGAECGHEHQTRMPGCRAIVHLGNPSRVSIVHQQDVPTEVFFEDLFGLGIDPRLVDVGCRPRLTVGHHSGDGDTDRAVADGAGEVFHDLTNDCCHVLRRRLFWGHDAKSLVDEFAGREVDGRSLDATAANVDAEHGCACYWLLAHAGEPSDTRPLRGMPGSCYIAKT